jgi:hypothetical protein
MFEIEKGIPIPTARRKWDDYPFDEMEIGESFFVPGSTSTAIAAVGNRHKPKRFTARKENDGVRVWRIE